MFSLYSLSNFSEFFISSHKKYLKIKKNEFHFDNYKAIIIADIKKISIADEIVVPINANFLTLVF